MENDERQPLLSNNPSISGSRERLISDEGPPPSLPPRRLPLYAAALSASLGALAVGTTLGWSSAAVPKIMNGTAYHFPVSQAQSSMISSFVALGAACVCYLCGFLMDRLGRKPLMLILTVPFTVGWGLITFPANVPALVAGRLSVGVAGGGLCVVIPAYVNEIADRDAKGALGTLFQLMVVSGVLFAFALGSYADFFLFNAVCSAIPLVFAFLFSFMPDSPCSLVRRNQTENAKKSLRWLRGPEYDIEPEFCEVVREVSSVVDDPTSLRRSFSGRAAKKALCICLSLMAFQQLSGINAILFNVASIFKAAGGNMSREASSVIVGAIQVAATFLSTLLIERLGRKTLLSVSASVMMLCLVFLGLYFHMLEIKNSWFVDAFSWLPLFSLCLYITAFSVGFGPIPWLVSGELCDAKIKPFACATVGTVCWCLTFFITAFFRSLQDSIGTATTFWSFSAANFIGFFFVWLNMPETKGKSIAEIQAILNN